VFSTSDGASGRAGQKKQAIGSAPEDVPRAILDAGGETGALLSHAIDRRMSEMAPGQVLQIISLDPRSRADVASWCRSSGNLLVHLQQDGNETWFWIRKR
jgi:TusA-related sulfurtransferase